MQASTLFLALLLAAGALFATSLAAADDLDGIGIINAAPLLCALLFVGILVFLETGRRIGAWRLVSDPEGARAGVGGVEGSVLALLGLLIAFTFSGAASRFDARRDLIVEETNAIGTAWLRLDLLLENEQPALRELFRQYLDSRIETYRKLPDVKASGAEQARSARLQQQMWQQAITASWNSGSPPTITLLMPALNDMFDIVSTRAMAARMHPPPIVFVMLAALALAAAILVGYGMAGGKSRNWVIIDLECPRFGFIRVDAADQMLFDLRETMR